MKRALLAEDDPTSRAFLVEALSLLGWEVEAVESGEAASARAITQPFEVVLLDLNLPGINGIQCLRQIRNHDHHASADAPAMALTADDRPELMASLRQQGFDASLPKPLSLKQLQQALTRLGLEARQSKSLTNEAANPQILSTWDDEAALVVLGGKLENLRALRQLMLADLPTQRDRILAAPESEEAHALLHRLRAACGFVGAARLARAVNALGNAVDASTRELACKAFADAVDELLRTPSAS